MDAILIASPSLHREIIKWKLKTNKSLKDKVVISGIKYYIRMACRPTPYGLFSGVSVFELNNPLFEGLNQKVSRRFYRLNYVIISEITKNLKTNNEVSKYLKYYSNPSINILTNSIRYISGINNNGDLQYELTEVIINELILSIINFTKTSELFDDIIKYLTQKGLTNDISINHIRNLIENAILLSEIDALLTGEDLSDIISILLRNGLNNENETLVRLKNINKILVHLNENDSNLLELYDIILADLRYLGIEINNEPALHVDLLQSRLVKFKPKLTEDIYKSIQFIASLKYSNKGPQDIFKDKFLNKYDAQEVPLLRALDPVLGLQYSDSINNTDRLADRNMIARNRKINLYENILNLNTFLFEKYLESIKYKNDVVYITEFEALKLSKDNDSTNLGISFNAIISIANNSNISKVQLIGVNSLSATRMISRFSYMHDRLEELQNYIIDLEKKKFVDAIVVDVRHLQDFKFGNISSHKAFRDFELTILSSTNDSQIKTINLNDLYLTIRNDKIQLFSRIHNREIIPILSSAENHNYSGIPIFKFLVDYGNSYWPDNINFSWGPLLNIAKVLPRIDFCGVIISPKIWIFKNDEIKEIIDELKSDTSFGVELWRIKNNIPRIINISFDEDEILLDLKNVLLLQVFSNIIKYMNYVMITESIYFPNESDINLDLTTYANQLVLTYCTKNKTDSHTSHKYIPRKKVKTEGIRFFLPGDKWVYYKIYTTEAVADKIIANELRYIILKLKNSNYITKFHYLRYNDPDFHIRIRVCYTDKLYLPNIIDSFNNGLNPLVVDGYVSNMVIDKYEREVERYGSNEINYIESIFCFDSLAMMNIIATKYFNYGEENRIITALFSLDKLFASFDFVLSERIDILNNYLNNFDSKYRTDKYRKVKLDKLFRKIKIEICRILNEEKHYHSGIFELQIIINRRSSDILHSFIENRNYKNIAQENISDIIHMSVNRISPINYQDFEYSIIYLIKKYYGTMHTRPK
jgi:thiopeptide-type bacteriocin biosynthesis protein